jgi:hypothetical protein
MTLKADEEAQVVRNNKLLTALFRLGQTAAAGIIVWIVSITYQEVKANGVGQVEMKSALTTIQADLASLKIKSQQDHDELVALRTRIQVQDENR